MPYDVSTQYSFILVCIILYAWKISPRFIFAFLNI